MLGHKCKGKETDRFITARSVERNKTLAKYIINDTPRNASQGKKPTIKTPAMISQGDSSTIKIYYSLLKSQLFPTSASSLNQCNTNDNSNSRHSLGIKINHTQYMKSQLTSKGDTSIVKNLNEMCFKSISKSVNLSLSDKGQSEQIDNKHTMHNSSNIHNIDQMNIRKYNSMINFTPNDSESESTLSLLCKKARLSNTSYKRLDCPNLKDDFYLHLLDWSSKDNLAVGLDNSLYIWNKCNSKVKEVNSLEDDSYTTLCWRKDGESLIFGTNDGCIKIWDCHKEIISESFPSHTGRIDIITNMSNNPNVFTSGSQDKQIASYDIRCTQSLIMPFIGHTQEVCGLKWSHDDLRLASGGNDNKLIIWNGRTSSLESKLNSHTSAVKAIDWSPHKFGYLLSGGGTQDRKIKLWNINTMKLEESIETCSQVCNIAFSKISKEFVSTHGYTDNYILVWDTNKMDVKAMLKGHQNRVLYMSVGPDLQSIVTGAGDDSIRFWKVFSPKKTYTHNCSDDSLNEKSMINNNVWNMIR